MRDGIITLDEWKNHPQETRRILPYHDHKLYLCLIDGRGKEPHLYPVNRWHALSHIKTGKHITELLAATCEDGVGVIARWVHTGDGWKVSAMDTENQEWEEITDWEKETVVTRIPPCIFDDNPDYYQ